MTYKPFACKNRKDSFAPYDYNLKFFLICLKSKLKHKVDFRI